MADLTTKTQRSRRTQRGMGAQREKTIRLRVGAVQMISEKDDAQGNICRALEYCDRAAKRGVQILCLPECASTGFDWLGNERAAETVYAEPVPGPMVERFAAKARETGMYINY